MLYWKSKIITIEIAAGMKKKVAQIDQFRNVFTFKWGLKA